MSGTGRERELATGVPKLSVRLNSGQRIESWPACSKPHPSGPEVELCAGAWDAWQHLPLFVVPARIAMEILGHAQIGTTMNIYAHVSSDVQREAAERMPDALWG